MSQVRDQIIERAAQHESAARGAMLKATGEISDGDPQKAAATLKLAAEYCTRAAFLRMYCRHVFGEVGR